MHKYVCGLLISVAMFAGVKRPDATIYQCSTMGALISGTFEGEIKVSELMKKGNFGFGMFGDLQGEMIAHNGQFYKFDDKGVPRAVKNSEKVAFATMMFFNATKHNKLKNAATMQSICDAIDPLVKNKNIPYAVRIAGMFKQVEMRNLSGKKEAYARLTDVRKDEKRYSASKIKGTVVGFWFPAYLSGISSPGYRFHFISDDRKIGGHVLAMSVDKGQIAVQESSSLDLYFPRSTKFNEVELNHDFTAAIDEIIQ
jgi:acetolactate decarboxylase